MATNRIPAGIRVNRGAAAPAAPQIEIEIRQNVATADRPALVEPSLLAKAVNFSKAAARHVAAGRPQATDEQVAERFAICKACPMFKPTEAGKGKCMKCGCGIKTVGVAGVSKLRWADQRCPIDKWGPITSEKP